ncbi:Oidioi.mRNA.OKI2018_I69.PAR.g9275.t1.cds [Oikopleura dioica]|uniref:Oidioi.mRNA.OKI2018_I69.PAR.g9275.t1.cds n=1 Tax=Oikopleura dioica TaxID=34765 RepID=A0ABN7RJW2_OIKDI|nr:Oidioi.mRNA.OKI2018_I69.PAR.g9275.t1.cds [Oikopleura dioica]
MRVFGFLILSGSCQDYQSRNYGSYLSPRDVGEETFDICSRWIYDALRCEPPRGKTSKYIHRFQKVIGDALWHVESTYKCSVNRGEYDEKSNEYEYEYEGDAVVASDGDIRKFEARSQMGLGRVRNDDLRSQCIESFARFYQKTDITSCRKKYAWKARTDGLTRQITKMMFICMKSNGY